MSHSSQAVLWLKKSGLDFALHPYDYDPNAQKIGLQAALALGLSPDQTFKTLMCLYDDQGDQNPVCVVIPSDQEVSFKKLSAHFKAKSAQMMKPQDAERLTGFKIGGISPCGQKKASPIMIDETALLFEHIYVNAGARGLLFSAAPEELSIALKAEFCDLCP